MEHAIRLILVGVIIIGWTYALARIAGIAWYKSKLEYLKGLKNHMVKEEGDRTDGTSR